MYGVLVTLHIHASETYDLVWQVEQWRVGGVVWMYGYDRRYG